MRSLIFILICLSLGVYRIDFAEWNGSFQLTPILISSVIFITYYTVRLIVFKSIKLPSHFFLMIILQILIIIWCAINIDYNDETELKRITLFTFLNYFGVLINLYIFNHSDPRKRIIKLLKLAMFVYLIMSGFQYYYFLQKIVYVEGTPIMPWLELYSQAISVTWPRLNGGFLDPNVAGYFLIFLYLSIHLIEKNSEFFKFKILIAICILLTVSRSAIVTFIIVNCLLLLYSQSIFNLIFQINIKKIIGLILILGFSLASIYYIDSLRSNNSNLNNRLTGEDKSAKIHFQLIDYGINKIFEEPQTFLTGYGFGSSYIYTAKFFSSSKYGNFHSELLTIQFETGIIGLLLYLSLLLTPIFLKRKEIINDKYYFILTLFYVSIFLENIFYQQFLFHYYWFFLLLPWFWLDDNFKKRLLI